MSKFVRADSFRWSKLGKNRKKLQKWRRSKGIDSKIRKKKKGHPTFPRVGFKSSRAESGKINGKVPVLVHNFKELEQASAQDAIIIARIGAKKRALLVKKANEMKLHLVNGGAQ